MPDCFMPGTAILTERGEIAVEDLRVGDVAITWSGGRRPVGWVCWGSASIASCRRDRFAPVTIRRDALSAGVPHCDLSVTPEHRLLIEGGLITAAWLVNGRSVVCADRLDRPEYFHVELDGHDLLVANGAPAESYRPDDQRRLLLAGQGGSAGWAAASEPCAPLIGPGIEAARRWRLVSERAGLGGEIVYEPDLHLLADGTRVELRRLGGDLWHAVLPGRPGLLRLCSRAAVPADLGAEFDHRALGVQVRRIVLAQGGVELRLAGGAAFLRDGFHLPEPDGRWTDGDALLPLDALTGLTGPLGVEIEIAAVAPTRRAPLPAATSVSDPPGVVPLAALIAE